MHTEPIVCAGLNELDEVASRILGEHPNARVMAVSGPMGAGKTTFIQSLCRRLKVKDTVNSPTFSIVNEYRTSTNEPVYHFDLYRLKKTEELLDIGYEDYFYSGNYCFIEWPEVASALIPEECLYISIGVDDASEVRRFMVS
ncbi:MAG: tRNA (adenosine(37)-N6)-threonylcarbamoyltransferase complex ATPase subunit type 1 TsaE [Lentimicrobium sp.]|jgi:tRNA threonylcarbamoyladenosine biosynthesis protein TsaE|nr:tRNA (adenosine(37)-N6)-threonylcarbamoyltransferase complex ATPase subunit type 1 TsaE [Lentimicrobium sp.]